MMGLALEGVKTRAVIQTLHLTYQIALKTIIRKLENGMWIACGRHVGYSVGGMWDRVWEACVTTCEMTCEMACEMPSRVS